METKTKFNCYCRHPIHSHPEVIWYGGGVSTECLHCVCRKYIEDKQQVALTKIMTESHNRLKKLKWNKEK